MAIKWENSSHLTNDLSMTAAHKSIYTDILNQQRTWLLNKNKEDGLLNEDVVRRHLQYIDLEEEKLKFI